ncbi:hypothetical protein HK102_002274 [Quaeritorhiza haematococci]|nr:hypothetical protein HK102_002274 [Quaeritorhiza haematococci]
MGLKILSAFLLLLATTSSTSADPALNTSEVFLSKRTFSNGGTNGFVTSYDSGAFTTQHCLGNTQARRAFNTNTGGINSRVSQTAQRTNKWVALNDLNLGPGFQNCGKCVKVTVDVRKGTARVAKTIGPLLVADRCGECGNEAIDLKSAAYRDLGLSGGGPITRGSVQPGQTDGGTTTMTTRWVPASCNEAYRVVNA